jgi:phosphatidylglycerol:prolipoprotein diacylglycerol transferase
MPPVHLSAFSFPAIDPIAFSLGPLEVRWYALAYIAGILFALWYAKQLLHQRELWGPKGAPMPPQAMDDLLLWATLGVILGGRLGYLLFYNPAYYLTHPAEVFQVWSGGMSFHGGFLGVIAACFVFGRRRGLGLDRLLDLLAAAAPVGLFLGRISNFINGELFGRPSDLPWAVIFPAGGPEPRHPSQLYEAALEGIVLFIVLRIATHRYGALARPGLLSGIFALGYGIARVLVEFAREPDPQLDYLVGQWLTMGMLLSLPVMAVGIWLIARSRRLA